jgi:hypothetical protein
MMDFQTRLRTIRLAVTTAWNYGAKFDRENGRINDLRPVEKTIHYVYQIATDAEEDINLNGIDDTLLNNWCECMYKVMTNGNSSLVKEYTDSCWLHVNHTLSESQKKELCTLIEAIESFTFTQSFRSYLVEYHKEQEILSK